MQNYEQPDLAGRQTVLSVATGGTVTPEEIKRSLYGCHDGHCEDCPYRNQDKVLDINGNPVEKDSPEAVYGIGVFEINAPLPENPYGDFLNMDYEGGLRHDKQLKATAYVQAQKDMIEAGFKKGV